MEVGLRSTGPLPSSILLPATFYLPATYLLSLTYYLLPATCYVLRTTYYSKCLGSERRPFDPQPSFRRQPQPPPPHPAALPSLAIEQVCYCADGHRPFLHTSYYLLTAYYLLLTTYYLGMPLYRHTSAVSSYFLRTTYYLLVTTCYLLLRYATVQTDIGRFFLARPSWNSDITWASADDPVSSK